MTDSTQEQQDQATVIQIEAKIVSDAETIETDKDALVQADEKLEADGALAQGAGVAGVDAAQPAALNVTTSPDGTTFLSTGTGAVSVTTTSAQPSDELTTVFNDGIAAYDGYPEWADSVTAIRELELCTRGMTSKSRDLLAAQLKTLKG